MTSPDRGGGVTAARPEARLSVPVSADRDHIQGPDGAPLTLVEYGDYECQYCGAAYPIVKQIQAQMGERLRFVFRNFPITPLTQTPRRPRRPPKLRMRMVTSGRCM